MEPAKDRIGRIIRILEKEYPRSRTMLAFATPFQLLVATILAAQSRDDHINKVTPGLFRKYPTIKAFAEASQAELEKDIHSTGFFRNKSKAIIGASKKIMADFGGKLPETMEELTTLPGVARKTANIVLSSGFGKAVGIAVDTHVRRLSQRLGLSREKDPNKIERDLMALVPKKDWIDFNYLLVNHGRAICHALRPECGICRLCQLCPSCGKV